VEETELYHLNQLKEQKKKLDAAYADRLKTMETIFDRKLQNRMDDMRKDYENELEKTKQNLLVTELDLKKSKEELSTLANEHDKLNVAFKEQLTKIKAQTNRNLTRTYNSGFDTALRLEGDEEDEEDEEEEEEEEEEESDEAKESNQMECDEVDEVSCVVVAKKPTASNLSIPDLFLRQFNQRINATEAIQKVSIGLDVRELELSILSKQARAYLIFYL
jgi:hypothetical protein